MNTFKAYKLVRKLKNGQLSPLFINRRQRLPFNVWLEAERHVTFGFKERVGWHCCTMPFAPHLSTKGRVWVEVELQDYEFYQRPLSQGGNWVLGQKIQLIREL